MYLVVNAVARISALTRRFDDLIRAATVNPHEASGFVWAQRGDIERGAAW